MPELRPYQSALYQGVREALRTHDSVLAQLPTGGGKTALSTEMCSTAASRGHSGAFIVHRVELVEQTMKTFDDFGVPYGVVAAGFAPKPNQPIQICSIDTLRSRLASGACLMDPRLVIWDECHHTGAAGWQKVKGVFRRAKHVGLTATPERLDGKPLRDQFTKMVCGPSTAWLMQQGWLCNYRAFAPQAPDLSQVRDGGSDYNKSDVDEAMDKPSITGNAVTEYLRHARDKRVVAFCTSVKNSQKLAAAFRDAGVLAWHLDGDTDKGERRQANAAFRRGEIKVLTNVGLFGEGYDLPALDGVMMLRPTKSLGFYLQMCGRAFRPYEGKPHALLFDHAGNIRQHGLPDDDRQWSLDGREKKKPKDESEADDPIRQCPRCFSVLRPMPRCPFCGYVWEVVAREVEHKEGDLRELDVEAERKQAAADMLRCQSIAELVDFGRKKGMASPEKWAAHFWTARIAGQRNRGAL